MANDGFNHSSVSVVGGAVTPLLDASHNSEGAKVRVSGADDDEHTYEAGLPDNSITLTCGGVTDIAVGDKGATAITWNDGGISTLTNSVVVAVATNGAIDGAITSTITVVPSTAAA